MKVAFLCATSERTGVETHLRMLALGLRPLGVTPVLVCSTPGPLVDQFERDGFAARVEAPRGRFGGLELARLGRALADVDVVHAHGPRAIYWSALIGGRRSGRATVATVHQFRDSGGDGFTRFVFSALESWSIRRHHRLIAVSSVLRHRLVAAGTAPPERIAVIPNSTPVLLERPLTPRTAEPPAHAVVVARLDRVKGVDLLLDAWALLALRGEAPPLTVIGDGIERAALEERARSAGLGGRVRFEGLVADVPSRLDAFSLYVAPSRNEGLPGAVLEAMAFGIPVVATRVGGHLDLFATAFPEVLVPPEDPAALADAVRGLLARSPGERLALGARLQQRAYEAFGPERIVAETLEVYRSARASVRP